MRVRVLFFGVLKDLAGKPSDTLDLFAGATVRDLLTHFESDIPRLKSSLPALAIAVNRQYVDADTRLQPDDEVALLPPVSGGSGRERASYASIVREPIDTARILAGIKNGEDGAAVIFEGIVRNQTRGRKTRYLEYEAYEAMALDQMDELAARAMKQFQIRDVALVHRLGRLEIGETSVLIVVASAHRAAAFEACRWLIDALKQSVPIWKKEYFEDGAVWPDGEPFPAEISGKFGLPGSPGVDGASK
jgi:molybdopterin synthase catalytic subunit